MKFPVAIRRILPALLFAAAGGWARAQTAVTDVGDFISYMDGYNLVALNAATFGSGATDVQGGIAVQKSLSISGDWSFAGNNTPANGVGLLFSGTGSSLSISSGSDAKVLGGTMSATGLTSSDYSWSSSNFSEKSTSGEISASNNSSSPLSTSAPSGWSWSTETTNLDNLSGSSGLGGLSQTSGASISVVDGVLTFAAPSSQTSGVVVFTLDVGSGGLNAAGDEYDGVSFSSIAMSDCASGVDYVINVVGLTSGDTLFEGVNDDMNEASQILWNLESTSAIDVTMDTNTEFYGSILAPEVDLTDSSSSATIDGQVAVDDFNLSNVQLDFAAETLVPEPRTYALWAVGLCAAAAVFLLRRRTGPAAGS